MSDDTDPAALQEESREPLGGVENRPPAKPNPGDYGVMLGQSPELDHCWEKFELCVESSKDDMSFQECIDKLNECRRKQEMGPDAQQL